jgi:hypothetical protein
MMRVEYEKGQPVISGEQYRLTCMADRPFVLLGDAKGETLAQLFVPSSVHPLQGRDDTVEVGEWAVRELEGEAVLELRARSSVWEEKVYRFRCQPQRFSYEIEVVGQGHLAEAHYFGGYYSGNLRWGSGFFPSGQAFEKGFNPEPNTDEINHFSPSEGSVIDITGVPLPGRGDWFFTPPPFSFAFRGQNEWMGMSVEAPAGANRFAEYRYTGQRGAFYLTLDYEGHTRVDGRYRLPAIGFDFGESEYEVLEKHVAALREAGCVPQGRDAETPDWWREPIFCGWGSQCYVARTEEGAPSAFARQHQYDQFLETLSRNDVVPGIVVIDDKWQATYGENAADEAKWPDLRGWVDGQHAAGRKVLLWLKAWDPEGVPAEECIRNAAGMPVSVDPTNPAFERRLRASVRQMLSAEGYDADGFKIDFSARIPSGPGMQVYGEAWGLELVKVYLGIIYDEAKRAKPDALIMTHTPHPYLTDVLDMIRLNDINTGTDIPVAMMHRARVAAIACPEALIDTDNWPITDRATWRTYVGLQTALGVPSLYYSSHVDTTGEPLEEEDYERIRQLWAAYRGVGGAHSRAEMQEKESR